MRHLKKEKHLVHNSFKLIKRLNVIYKSTEKKANKIKKTYFYANICFKRENLTMKF